MPEETGIWSQEEADKEHVFSYFLARWIAAYFDKKKGIPIIDMGCGKGTYLRYFKEVGFIDLYGIEGSNLDNFEIRKDNIMIYDLSKPLIPLLGRKGDVLCLEVIEHIPKEFQNIVFDNIRDWTDDECYAIISVAIPGQGGLGHVNCMPNLLVIKEMMDRGFECLLEDSIKAREVIENHCHWFRDTLLVFKKK